MPPLLISLIIGYLMCTLLAISIRMLKKMYSDSKHKKAKKLSSANARTPLHEAAEAHHLTVFIELIRLKVDGITKVPLRSCDWPLSFLGLTPPYSQTYLGNTPIHLLMSSEAPQGVTAARCCSDLCKCADHSSRPQVSRTVPSPLSSQQHDARTRVGEPPRRDSALPRLCGWQCGMHLSRFHIATHA